MSTIEILILTAVGLFLVSCLCYIFFYHKKKIKAKKEDKKLGEKKVEQAIKPKKDEKAKQEEQETKEEVKEEKKETEKALEKNPFKIIRKKSEVKINKKALKNGSRNPSITKVFDKEGNRVDLAEEEQINKERIEKISEDVQDLHSTERFIARDYNISDESSEHEYKIIAPKGSPNRAPIIGDRTNFASHLNISEDGNMSGIIGTGVKKIIDRVDDHSDDIEQRTQEMIRNVHRNLYDEMDFLDMYQTGTQDIPDSKTKVKDKLKNIDAQTLIIADAISNPKSKRK